MFSIAQTTEDVVKLDVQVFLKPFYP